MANKTVTKLGSKFSELPPWAKGIIGVGLVLAGGFVIYKVYQRFTESDAQDREEAKNTENELLKAMKKTPLTFPLSQYNTFANQIETAGFDIGTDEDAIYNVFRKLKNNADYLALIEAWGKPNRKVYEWGIGRKMTLTQFIRYEMNDSEIKKINAILGAKGITYRV